MYEEAYLKNEYSHQRTKTELCIESVDVVTSYTSYQQNLKFAVSVLNLCGEPVHESEVVLAINRPDGSRISLSQKTDSQGVALFELDDIDRGRWEAVVFKVRHTDYKRSLNHHSQRWSVVYV